MHSHTLVSHTHPCNPHSRCTSLAFADLDATPGLAAGAVNGCCSMEYVCTVVHGSAVRHMWPAHDMRTLQPGHAHAC
jgi:hypothetical protein